MKKLYIDYDRFLDAGEGKEKCSYRLHPCNDGIACLKEEVSFLLACRRCEDYPCVNSCPNGALKRESGVIRRSNIICVSCKTCSIACPFGTILTEQVPYITGRCDVCLGRLKDDENPLCVDTCESGALMYIEEEEIKDRENIYKVGENIIVRVFNWLEFYGIKK